MFEFIHRFYQFLEQFKNQKEHWTLLSKHLLIRKKVYNLFIKFHSHLLFFRQFQLSFFHYLVFLGFFIHFLNWVLFVLKFLRNYLSQSNFAYFYWIITCFNFIHSHKFMHRNFQSICLLKYFVLFYWFKYLYWNFDFN